MLLLCFIMLCIILVSGWFLCVVSSVVLVGVGFLWFVVGLLFILLFSLF